MVVKLLAIVLTIAMTCGCTKTVHLPSEVRIVDRETTRLQPVPIHIDREIILNRTSSDSSHLENRWCISSARIDTLGNLTHTLEQKQTEVIVQVPTTERVIVRDSLVYITIKGDTVTKNVTPTWCWWLLAGVAGYLFIGLRRRI